MHDNYANKSHNIYMCGQYRVNINCKIKIVWRRSLKIESITIIITLLVQAFVIRT